MTARCTKDPPNRDNVRLYEGLVRDFVDVPMTIDLKVAP